jgi:hypothetical protein
VLIKKYCKESYLTKERCFKKIQITDTGKFPKEEFTGKKTGKNHYEQRLNLVLAH